MFRVSRLIVEDSITDTPRAWLIARVPDKLGELVECIWCMSVWCGLAATLLYAASPEVAFWIALPFALSAIAGILDSIR